MSAVVRSSPVDTHSGVPQPLPLTFLLPWTHSQVMYVGCFAGLKYIFTATLTPEAHPLVRSYWHPGSITKNVQQAAPNSVSQPHLQPLKDFAFLIGFHKYSAVHPSPDLNK